MKAREKQHSKPCVLCAIGFKARHLRKMSADLLLCIDPETRVVYQMGRID